MCKTLETMEDALSDLSVPGIVLFVVYPVLLISAGLYSLRNKEVSLSGYFFAGRNTSWPVLGLSFFITSLFGPYILAVIAAPDYGIALPVFYGIISVIMLAILGRYLAPHYLKLRLNTFPEYFEKRFSRSCSMFISSLYIAYNIFFRLSVIIITGSVFIHILTGYDPFTSMIYFLVVTGIYVIIGGLQSEMHTALLQSIIIIPSALALAVWVLLQNNVPGAADQPGAIPAGESNVTGFTLAGLILALPVLGFFFWCLDEIMVQRVLSAESEAQIKKAASFSSLLQAVPVLILVLPALAIGVIPQEGGSSGSVLSRFSGEGLPPGLHLALTAAVLSAIMASVANVFNSTSALITFNFFGRLKPASSERKLILIGRLTTLFLLFCSVLLVPASQPADFTFCLGLFKASAYLAAMTSAVFITGILNSRINAQSAFLTLCLVTLVIAVKVILDLLPESAGFESGPAAWLSDPGFLEFSVFIFLFSMISLFTFRHAGQSLAKAGLFLKSQRHIPREKV